jgi:predicted DNA-binding transcriptional regulator YafY
MLSVPHALEDGVNFGTYLPLVRTAIRDSRKLHLSYADASGHRSERTIWPLGLYLYSHVTLVCAWCEARQDFRAFRSERIDQCAAIDERFDSKNGALMQAFLTAFEQRRQE